MQVGRLICRGSVARTGCEISKGRHPPLVGWTAISYCGGQCYANGDCSNLGEYPCPFCNGNVCSNNACGGWCQANDECGGVCAACNDGRCAQDSCGSRCNTNANCAGECNICLGGACTNTGRA